MTEGEELMLDLLASSSNSLPVALERLLQCGMSIFKILFTYLMTGLSFLPWILQL